MENHTHAKSFPVPGVFLASNSAAASAAATVANFAVIMAWFLLRKPTPRLEPPTNRFDHAR
jgi:hypothetical protein